MLIYGINDIYLNTNAELFVEGTYLWFLFYSLMSCDAYVCKFRVKVKHGNVIFTLTDIINSVISDTMSFLSQSSAI